MLKDDFFKYLAQTTDHPFAIEVSSSEGVYIYDNAGKRYTDMISGLAVNNIGHRHPKVVEAVKDQVDRYLHVIPYGEFIQSPQVELARRLREVLPKPIDTTYIVNSGTEANEAALKLSKRVTGRSKIVAFHGSYHGSTHGSLSVTGNENKKYAARPLLPGVEFIGFDDPGELQRIDETTACVIIEPIQGDAGVRIPDKEYMRALRRHCTEVGALLIFDEIQTGFGRTGKMFAFEHFGITPDIITMAKALGGGMPIGAFASSSAYMYTLTHDPILGHITTFGGHPVSCAAACANLEVLTTTTLIQEAEKKGKLIEELLCSNKIIEIRRKGLMIAVQFDSFETVEKIVARCLEDGVICFWFLSCNDSFRLAPPLTITENELREACHIINNAINSIA